MALSLSHIGFWNLLAVLLVGTAGFALFNERWLKLPPTIGIMLLAILSSLSLVALQQFGFDLATPVRSLLGQVRFDHSVLHGFIGFLMFSGGLSVEIDRLKRNAPIIATLALIATLLSTAIVGLAVYYAGAMFNFNLSLLDGLLFGALISPTDPIAVLAILRKLHVPADLEMQITGESLFNDGVGITLFLLLFHLKTDHVSAQLDASLLLFLREALGGVITGAVLAWLARLLLRGVRNHQVMILGFMAVASGGFALAEMLQVSGALAMVTAGLLLGGGGTHYQTLSTESRDKVLLFWDITDDILNALLFMLLGLEFLPVFKLDHLLLLASVVPLVLSARLVSVALPLALLQRESFDRGTLGIMTWGGLRGALAVALALSLPADGERQLIVSMTYAVVIFSVLVQGTSLRYVIQRLAFNEKRVE